MLDLTQLTITGLLKALTDVERAIRACDPVFTLTGEGTPANPRLIDLAAQEQQICDELASRRRDIREQLDTRFAALIETSTFRRPGPPSSAAELASEGEAWVESVPDRLVDAP